jgi:hypothetical protein
MRLQGGATATGYPIPILHLSILSGPWMVMNSPRNRVEKVHEYSLH